MKVKVRQVLNVEEKISKSSGKPYKLTSFLSEDGVFYKDTYGVLEEGKEYEGEVKDGKFEVARTPYGGGGGRAADPATRASIERQSALKAAVEAVYNYHSLKMTDIAQLDLNGYATQIVKLSKHFVNTMGEVAVVRTTDINKVTAVLEEIASKPESDQIDLDDIPF